MFLQNGKTLEIAVEKRTVQYDGFAFDSDTRGAKKKNLLYGAGKNCAVKNAALERGVGLETFIVDGNELRVLGAEYLPYQLFCVWEKNDEGEYVATPAYTTKNGDFYILREGAYWEYMRNFGTPTCAFTTFGEDGALQTALVGAAGMYLYSQEQGVQSSVLNRTTRAGCSFMGRTFCAVAPSTLVFSAPFAPRDFSSSLNGGGKIGLLSDKGEVVALVPLEDKIYIFQEFGICVLTPAGAAREFVIETIEYQGGRILEGGVGACATEGARAIFLAEDGVYEFNGKRVKKTCENLEVLPKRGGQVCVHAVFEGKYYVRFLDEKNEERLLVLDGVSGEGYYAFVPMALGAYPDGVACVCGVAAYRLREGKKLPENEVACFAVRGLEFGKRGVKCLERLTFYGCGNAKITVGNGKKSKSFFVELTEGVAMVKPFLRGRRFSLEIELAVGAKITGIAAEIESVSGVK